MMMMMMMMMMLIMTMIMRHCNDLPAAFPPPASAPCYAGLHCLPAHLPLPLVPVLVVAQVPAQVEWVVF